MRGDYPGLGAARVRVLARGDVRDRGRTLVRDRGRILACRPEAVAARALLATGSCATMIMTHDDVNNNDYSLHSCRQSQRRNEPHVCSRYRKSFNKPPVAYSLNPSKMENILTFFT